MKNVLGIMVMLFIIPVSVALAHNSGWGHMMDWGHMNYWSGGVIVFLVLLLGLIGVVAYFVINQKKMRRDYRDQENETVIEILKERYAKGEISKKQYEEMKKTLV